MSYQRLLVSTALIVTTALSAQTIAEKKAGLTRGGGEFDQQTLQQLKQVNHDLRDKQTELRALYARVLPMYEAGAPEDSYRDLVQQIKELRAEITSIELGWRETITDVEKGEAYGLWAQTGTTLEQLIIDYGSQSFVYLIPPEIGKIPLSIASAVPIPRALWGEMLEFILAQEGVGIQQLNPYLRSLYLMKDTQSGIKLITNDRKELEFLPKDARIAFIISPDPTDARRVGSFLERFINPRTTSFSMVGRDLLIVTSVGEIQELLKLYDFVAKNRGDLEYKLVPLLKTDTKEMSDILQSIFEQIAKQEAPVVTKDGERAPPSMFNKLQGNDANSLKVIPLTQVARAVFLLGTKDEIVKAEEIIREVEEQVGSARGKIVYTYRTKHSDPEELAALLSKIYMVFASEKLQSLEEMRQAEAVTAAATNAANMAAAQGFAPGTPPGYVPGTQPGLQLGPNRPPLPIIPTVDVTTHPQRANIYSNPFPTTVDDSTAFYQSGAVIVAPAPILMAQPFERLVNQGRDNFIVDPKTGYIVMVVEPDLLPRMKDLIKRIDVPPKMVQLDVLLFEKSNKHTNNFGLNLLKTADAASGNKSNSVTFNAPGSDPCTGACTQPSGIFAYMISRPASDWVPAYDLAYRFLMSQDDVTINANPSVVTVNQTPARIAVVVETSISTGVVEVQAAGGIQAKDAFTRAQYGTNITITPIIHGAEEGEREFWDDSPDYITLLTEVNFDTTSPTSTNRPDVTRRNIKNQVRVPDGKTVILGGLRNKQTIDDVTRVPFLGEVPGVGKLFSTTALADNSTEMFIFITPTIIADICADFDKMRLRMLARRPGDIPDFLCALDRARRAEQEALFHQGMEILLGRRFERCIEWGEDSCDRLRGWGNDCYDGCYER